MMTDSITPRKKFTNEEIIASISFLAEVGQLDDEKLRKRDLKIGEAQKVNHFIDAVREGESTCLPKQAATLLRLTPLLLERGSNTVHCVLLAITPVATDAYKKATDLSEKRSLAEAIKTAGMVCVNRRLGATSRENREIELMMFEPFIGKTPEYQMAKARFLKRNRLGMIALRDVGQQAENAIRVNPYGLRYYGRGSRE